MGAWILFIVMNVSSGMNIETQEFASRTACEQSAKIVWDRAQKIEHWKLHDVYCLPKYVKDK